MVQLRGSDQNTWVADPGVWRLKKATPTERRARKTDSLRDMRPMTVGRRTG